jgi:hypothetical protein
MKSFQLTVWACVASFFIAGCSKSQAEPEQATDSFVRYTIPRGAHYSLNNGYTPVDTDEMKFQVRFDSSAIYTTSDPVNQYDINKLFGFSDNNAVHHQFSARFGWRWSDEALRLFAYVYNEGSVISRELSTVKIGDLIECSIRVSGAAYLFTVDGQTTALPRASTPARATGYQLYPYFGGDELSPHEINIWIKTVKN